MVCRLRVANGVPILAVAEALWRALITSANIIGHLRLGVEYIIMEHVSCRVMLQLILIPLGHEAQRYDWG
jgi:hypothetical protein